MVKELIFVSVDKPVTDGGIGGVEYLKQGVDKLIELIDSIVIMNNKWVQEKQTRAGISAWEVGLTAVNHPDYIDYMTKGQDFSSDVFSRAQYFAENGY